MANVALFRGQHAEVRVGDVQKLAQFIVAEVQLDRADVVDALKVEDDPLSFAAAGGNPAGAAGFVGQIASRMVFDGRRGCRRLFIGKQHPTGEQGAGISGLFREIARIIGIILVAVHDTVLVEADGEQAHFPACKRGGADHGRGVPVVAILVGKGTAVAGALIETTADRGERTGFRKPERSQRLVGDIVSIAVDGQLGCGGGIL